MAQSKSDAVPVFQVVKPIEIAQEDHRQAHQVGLGIQTQEPEEELGGHKAEKEAQEKGEEDFHGLIFTLSGPEYQGKGIGARGQGAAKSAS